MLHILQFQKTIVKENNNYLALIMTRNKKGGRLINYWVSEGWSGYLKEGPSAQHTVIQVWKPCLKRGQIGRACLAYVQNWDPFPDPAPQQTRQYYVDCKSRSLLGPLGLAWLRPIHHLGDLQPRLVTLLVLETYTISKPVTSLLSQRLRALQDKTEKIKQNRDTWTGTIYKIWEI